MQIKNLTDNDADKYLCFGKLTKPFLSDDFVKEKVMLDYNNKTKQGIRASVVESLYLWINHNIKISKDKEFKAKWKFNRTAEQIWNSGFATGCTDYAILFATFARQIKIPTTFLHTAEYNWTQRLIFDEDCKIHYGHSFCECFVGNQWILVDPTCCKVQTNYSTSKIELNYCVAGNNVFVPYFRGLDLGQKQNIKQHNKIMDKLCKHI